MELSDHDLVDGVMDRISEPFGGAIDEDTIRYLEPADQVVVLALGAKGIIDNGGFIYFYTGATNTLAVADAFDALGFTKAAAACRQAHAAVPEDVLALGYGACGEWLEGLKDDEASALFDKFSEVIWELDYEDLYTALAAHIHTYGLI